MSGDGLDQEQLLMWLLANASGKRSGVSQALNNLDNPIYGAMVGGYNPLTQASTGGGQLWSRYSGVEDEDLRTIMDMIEEGQDKYTIGSMIDTLYGDAITQVRPAFEGLGLQEEQVRSLVDDLQKEYVGGQQEDVFAKAGLSNPIDVYTPETVPLSSAAQSQVSQYDQMLQLAAKNLQKAESMYSPEARSLKEQADVMDGDEGFSLGGAIKGLGKRALTAALPPFGQVQSAKDLGSLAKSLVKSRGGTKKIVEDKRALLERASGILESNRQQRAEAAIARGMALKEVQETQRKRDLFMKGYIEALTEQGRTPFKDETQARLAMYQLLAK